MLGLMNAVVEGMDMHLDDNALKKDDPANVGAEAIRAMLNYGKALDNGFEKRSSGNKVLKKFPMRTAIATYFTSALMNATHTDNRPWCVRENRCVQECGGYSFVKKNIMRKKMRI